MLWLYLKFWEREWIFGRVVKAIYSLGVRSPCLKQSLLYSCLLQSIINFNSCLGFAINLDSLLFLRALHISCLLSQGPLEKWRNTILIMSLWTMEGYDNTYRLWSCKSGDTKLVRFKHKDACLQRKILKWNYGMV